MLFHNYNKETRERYLNVLKTTARMPETEAHRERFKKLYRDYCVFCAERGLDEKDEELEKLARYRYIVSSSPNLTNVRQDKLVTAITDLVNKGRVTDDEVDYILTNAVMIARELISKDKRIKDIKVDPLYGFDGYTQALTLNYLEKIGLKTTTNNTINFPGENLRHLFGTCTFPVSNGKGIINKTYLIDLTYRQYFTVIGANEGRFFTSDKKLKNNCGPDVGYYVCQDEEGQKFAKELLKEGFIELTPWKAKIYGNGFDMVEANRLNREEVEERVKACTGEEYLNIIMDEALQVPKEYTEEQLANYKREVEKGSNI